MSKFLIIRIQFPSFSPFFFVLARTLSHNFSVVIHYNQIYISGRIVVEIISSTFLIPSVGNDDSIVLLIDAYDFILRITRLTSSSSPLCEASKNWEMESTQILRGTRCPF